MFDQGYLFLTAVRRVTEAAGESVGLFPAVLFVFKICGVSDFKGVQTCIPLLYVCDCCVSWHRWSAGPGSFGTIHSTKAWQLRIAAYINISVLSN